MAFPLNPLHNVGGARSLARSSLRVLCNIVVREAGRGDCVTLRIQFPSTVVDRCFLSIYMYSHEYLCGLRIDHLVFGLVQMSAEEMYAHSQSALIVSCVDQISQYPRWPHDTLALQTRKQPPTARRPPVDRSSTARRPLIKATSTAVADRRI